MRHHASEHGPRVRLALARVRAANRARMAGAHPAARLGAAVLAAAILAGLPIAAVSASAPARGAAVHACAGRIAPCTGPHSAP